MLRIKSVKVKFAPLEHVKLKMIDHIVGRVTRIIIEHGNQPLYNVHYVVDGDCRQTEFYEDELERVR